MSYYLKPVNGTLYFWGLTLQKMNLHNQNKGHLASRYIISYIYNHIVLPTQKQCIDIGKSLKVTTQISIV